MKFLVLMLMFASGVCQALTDGELLSKNVGRTEGDNCYLDITEVSASVYDIAAWFTVGGRDSSGRTCRFGPPSKLTFVLDEKEGTLTVAPVLDDYHLKFTYDTATEKFLSFQFSDVIICTLSAN